MKGVPIRYIVIGLTVLLFFAGVDFTSSVSYAQGPDEREWVFPAYYPDGFDGTGYILRIASDEVVIDDSLYKFAPFVKYGTPTTEFASKGSFKVGTRVGFITNSNQEIISMWLIDW